MYSSKTVTRSSVDIGLQKFLVGIYNYMALGLGLTAAIVFTINVAPPAIRGFFHSIAMVAGIAGFFIAWTFTARAQRLSLPMCQKLFWGYTALVGVSLSSVVFQYSIHAVSRAFFITALTFGAASAYGYMAKRDLTRIASFCMMGVFGVIIASVVNLFLGSSLLDFGISIFGVLLFTGLTAYDTQAMRDMYFHLPHDPGVRERASILGALRLYLDVLNIFLYLLRLVGNRD